MTKKEKVKFNSSKLMSWMYSNQIRKQDFAEMMGSQKSIVSRLFKYDAMVTVDTIKKVAQYTGIKEDELIM